MMKVKGTAVVVVPSFIKSRFQETGWERWLQTISPEAFVVYTQPILSNLWYDYQKILVEPTLKICELFYEGKYKGAFELGKFSADYALRGIYKLFVKFGSPEFIITKGMHILPKYYQPSAIEITEAKDGSAIVRITEFPEMHPVVEQRIAGWIHQALELSGCRAQKIEITSSLAKKQPYTEFVLSWKK